MAETRDNRPGNPEQDVREEEEQVVPILEDENSEQTVEEREGQASELSADEYKEKWLRAVAELDNVRKRSAREIQLTRKRERERLLRTLIEVIDNLERALDSHGAESNPWLEGIEGIRLQMLDVLRQNDAEPFEAVGERFDPQRHHAVATAEIADKEPGTVVDVTRVGYQMKDGTILRPADVIVTK